MKILVISNNYPSNKYPSHGVFVYKLVQEFAKLGHEISVISPTKIGLSKGNQKKSTYGTELCEVYRPKYFSASAKRIGNFNTYKYSQRGQVLAVKRTVRKKNIEFDVVYAHFITNAIIAVEALSEYNKPIFGAIGESNIDASVAFFNSNYFKRIISNVQGFIAVSAKLRDKLASFGVAAEKILLKPNAVNLDIYYPRDKIEMRNKFGFPKNKKILIFVGRLIEHKGPLRLLEAVRNLTDINLIFVGSGSQNPIGDNIVFKGEVHSEVVPELLSSADLFVLPTSKEGSCNAIVEAMACGLPIISSDIPEVRDQCDDSFSILIDPFNISALRSSITEILSDPQTLSAMSQNAREFSRNFDVKNRAREIIEFISTK
ncbi:glycosyltransferase family 4 protein [Robiginitalea marina]|uniref:Glycosyltransferase family 4 protein n=1 Tax=Robiginitalea marina TaxID=2954105 RepID=A0ABT1AUJ4_9FLAO|nr:glycosyltransferase family 4 protein [Robiginitalea marina]MCO5723329.1 glycosyltransferase family 4 protein [Robiginitalea marina]